jgi:hypothetical protein
MIQFWGLTLSKVFELTTEDFLTDSDVRKKLLGSFLSNDDNVDKLL